MKQKSLIGKMISVHFTDRKTPVFGYLIDETAEWSLLKSNPVDYLTDGYVILRNKNRKEYSHGEEEKWKEKVMNLKGLQPSIRENIPITDLETILSHLTKKFGVFQLSTKSESTCYLGKLNSINAKELVIDALNPKGKWIGSMRFKHSQIRVIEYDTDYIRSLILLNKSYKRVR